jgi:hypothetical protein
MIQHFVHDLLPSPASSLHSGNWKGG